MADIVEEYLTTFLREMQAILQKIRQIILEKAPEAVKSIA